ncbi:hypothetical protein ACFFMN_23110 [Planobispora siamensis]|uniref:Uncharacterized protein n=1 Tax=Planobispora siamensis TaxID=936338 RepID=A0A8J3SL47_9ACTN|nr:hypothetical protein [Planobispora siamensis]GIH95249.1 hypothetical protein Psi01_58790 [Planobispora siamensis]
MNSTDEILEAGMAAALESFDIVFIDATTRGESLDQRVEAALRAALQARDAILASAGYLVVPAPVPTDEELDEAARWLAEASQCQRFAGENWRKLRYRPHLVDFAAGKARTLPKASQSDHAQAITAAETILKKYPAEPPKERV